MPFFGVSLNITIQEYKYEVFFLLYLIHNEKHTMVQVFLRRIQIHYISRGNLPQFSYILGFVMDFHLVLAPPRDFKLNTN